MIEFKSRLLKSCLLALATVMPGCGPGEVAPDCVPVDAQIGIPGDRLWCDGEFYPETLEWEGQSPVETFGVCLAPSSDGECELCPTAKVTDAVESGLLASLAEYRPTCALEHWELGCMWSIEQSMAIGREPNYCCFQVAVWGDGCADQP